MGWIAAACVLFISLWVWNKGDNRPDPVSGGSRANAPVVAEAAPSLIPVLYNSRAEAKYDKLAALENFIAPQHRLYDKGNAFLESKEGPLFVDI